VAVIGNVVGPMVATALYPVTHIAPYLLNAAIMTAVLVLVLVSRRVRAIRA
jgi:hypothetical protein